MSALAPTADTLSPPDTDKAVAKPAAQEIEAFDPPRPLASRGIDWVIRACGETMTFLWVALICLILFVVFNRYVLGITSTFNEELMRAIYAIGWLVGLSYAITADKHVRIDLISERMRPVTRAVIEFLGLSFLLIPFALWGSLDAYSFVEFYFLNGDASSSPGGLEEVWRVRMVMIIGFALILFAAYSRLMSVSLFLAQRRALFSLLALLACLGLIWSGLHTMAAEGSLGQVTAEGLAEAREEIVDLREDIADDLEDESGRLPSPTEIDTLVAAYAADGTVPEGVREKDLRELVAFQAASARYTQLDTQTAVDPSIPLILLAAAFWGVAAVVARAAGTGGLVLPAVFLGLMLALTAYGVSGALSLEGTVSTAMEQIPEDDEYAEDFQEAGAIQNDYFSPTQVAITSAALVILFLVLGETLGVILPLLRLIRPLYLAGGLAAGIALVVAVINLSAVTDDVGGILDQVRAAAIAGDDAPADTPILTENQRFKLTQLQRAPSDLITLLSTGALLSLLAFGLALARRSRPGLWIALGAASIGFCTLVWLLGLGLTADLADAALLAAAPALGTAQADMALAMDLTAYALIAMVTLGGLAILVSFGTDIFACALVSLGAGALILREVAKWTAYYAQDTRPIMEQGRYDMLPVLAEITATFLILCIAGYMAIWMIGWLARHSYKVEPPSDARRLVDQSDIVDDATRNSLHKRMETSSTP